jgi:hypothetical protein
MRQPNDIAQVLNNVALIQDLKTLPQLLDRADPRRQHIVGVLATTSVPDTNLLSAARTAGVWLLTPDGSGYQLQNPSEEAIAQQREDGSA